MRHFDVRAIKNYQRISLILNARSVILSFWDYKDADSIPSSNDSFSNLVIPNEFKLALDKVDNFKIHLQEPQATDVNPSILWTHALDYKLNLKPNLKATSSWFTALNLGSQYLTADESERSHWILFRPDIHILKLNLVQLNLFLNKFRLKDNEILIGKRHIPHMVLKIDNGYWNLPIDHFYIGNNATSGVFLQLTEYLENVITGKDKRQPIVNEFLLGQYIHDKHLKVIELPLPYIIRRKNLGASLTPNANSRFRKYTGLFRNILFLAKETVQLQLFIFFPKLIYKFQV
jgi:hypothetical protein